MKMRMQLTRAMLMRRADGQVKCALDATDGLRLYCYFQSDSPAYEEVIYDLTLAGEGASTDVTNGGAGAGYGSDGFLLPDSILLFIRSRW